MPAAFERSISVTPTATRSKMLAVSFPGKAIRNGGALAAEMFLGIDHTAIVIDDTQASLKFYRMSSECMSSARARTTDPSRST